MQLSFRWRKFLQYSCRLTKVRAKCRLISSPKTPNHTRTLKSAMRINNEMVPPSEMGFNVAVPRRSTCCFLKLVSLSLFENALLTRLRPALLWRRQMFGSSCCALTSVLTASLYVDFGRRIKVVGSTCKYDSAKITGDGP